MNKAEVMQTVRAAFETVTGCCLHSPQFLPDDIKDVLYYDEYLGEYSEYSTTLVVSLTEGGFGLYTAWADYTGHGCQCDSMTVTASTIHSLLAHMTEQEVIALFAEPVRDDVNW